MTVITTVAELDALPVGSPIDDCDGDTWQKIPNGNWSISPEAATFGINAAYLLETYAPLRIAGPATLHMTKCIADGCQTTHPLPPGSSWACPEHTTHIPGEGS